MVKTFQFQDREVPSPGFGAMGLSFGLGSNLSLEQAEPVLLKAIELGCTFWDTAVIYQAGVNEKLLGDFVRKHNVRDKIFSKSSDGVSILQRAPSPLFPHYWMFAHFYQLLPSAVSNASTGSPASRTRPLILKNTSKAPLSAWASLPISTICIESTQTLR